MKQSCQARLADQRGGNVIAFVPRAPSPSRLSMRDRMDIAEWREAASQRGFDQLILHERGTNDPPELESFLGIYRRGTNWPCWSVVRRGAWIFAWRGAAGPDVGRYATVADALEALLK